MKENKFKIKVETMLHRVQNQGGRGLKNIYILAIEKFIIYENIFNRNNMVLNYIVLLY